MISFLPVINNSGCSFGRRYGNDVYTKMADSEGPN